MELIKGGGIGGHRFRKKRISSSENSTEGKITQKGCFRDSSILPLSRMAGLRNLFFIFFLFSGFFFLVQRKFLFAETEELLNLYNTRQ